MTKTPFLIGIAGGSCSGKTLIAERLSAELKPETTVVVLGLDSYYNDFSGVPHDQIEVDVPEALDKHCLVDQLRSLSEGSAVERPVYDYATHSRQKRGEHVDAADVVVVEGLFVLFWPEVRQLLDLKVFVDIDHPTALSRRLERDVRDRGRTKESVLYQYEKKVAPNFERYVLPTREYADITLNGTDPVGDSVREIRARLK